MLGYDIDDAEVRRVLADHARRVRGPRVSSGADPRRAPRCSACIADLRALTRPAHDEADPDADLLGSPRAAPARLPALTRREWRAPARSASPPTCDERSPTTASPASTARRRSRMPATGSSSGSSGWSARAAAVLAILDRRLELAADHAGLAGDDFRDALDRLILASEGRDPIVSDLARAGPVPLLRRAGHRGRPRARLCRG